MFDSVFGHKRILTMLTNMVKNERLHQGLLFHGPNGIGKRLIAKELGKALMCETKNACGTCKHCNKYQKNLHPDYLEIQPDGNQIKVQQIRDISQNLHFRPFEARYRMVVLDQVETLREAAANAFLKSLEEPPNYVFFVLVTSDPAALLPTIRSRCQKVGFQNLSSEDRAQILTHKFQREPELADKLSQISFRRLETEPEAWDTFSNDVEAILKFLEGMLRSGQGIDFFGEQLRDKAQVQRLMDHMIVTLRECAWAVSGTAASTLFDPWRERLTQLVAGASVNYWREAASTMIYLAGNQHRHLNNNLWFNSFSINALGLQESAQTQMKARLSR